MRHSIWALLVLGALCAATAAASRRDPEAERLLRESLRQLRAGRTLKQGESAFSSASGPRYASASASAGGGQASTQQSAGGGPGSQVQGISQAGNKVDVCQRGPANSAECSTLTTADRSSGCTDIAPDERFTCAEQAKFNKCDSDFIFMRAFCLKSCNRCGSGCFDTAPSGLACAVEQCNATAVASGPFCLKTCGRCSAAQ